MFNSFISFAALIAALFLAACALPDRSDPGAFTSYRQGEIPLPRVPAFTDCVMDGFTKAKWIGSSLTMRQQRRALGVRVETSVDAKPAALASADIFDDGRVELFERKHFQMLDERAAFDACLERFR